MADKNPFPKIEILPHAIERGLNALQRAATYTSRIVFNHNVQLCESSHYVREHFTEAPVQPAGGLPPAQPWIETQPQLPLADAGWNANGEFERR